MALSAAPRCKTSSTRSAATWLPRGNATVTGRLPGYCVCFESRPPQTNKQSANQQSGESGDDFFASLDKSGDGSIDKEEATAFFKSVAAMMAGGGNKDEV